MPDVTNIHQIHPPDARPAAGNSYNWKWLGIGVVVELVIIGMVLVSQYQFATRFSGEVSEGNPVFHFPEWMPYIGGERTMLFAMAIIGGLTMAFVELCRVPLICSARAHAERSIRILCWVLAMAAVLVTTKSLAQVFEQQFHTRLVQVTRTANELEEKRAALAKVESGAKAPGKASEDIQKRLAEATQEKLAANRNIDTIGKRPPPQYRVDRNKRGQVIRRTPIPQKWDGEKVQAQIDEIDRRIAELRKEASEASANVGRAEADVASAREAVIAAESARTEAVLESQLHSFTGMIYGKAPNQVSDAEVYSFMRWFVLFAAFLGACTATGVAAAGITRHREETKPLWHVTHEVRLPSSLRRIVRTIDSDNREAA